MHTSLTLLTKGFQVFEQRIIETTARLSKSRSPELSLLAHNASVSDAEIIFIDGNDTSAMQWARENSQLFSDKTVIWVDANPLTNSVKHSRMNRPILWVNLPIILTRILEEQDLKLAEYELQQTTSQIASTPISGSSVLVVDDSQAVRDYLVKTLNENGYSVTAAEDGEVAINAAESQYFDCVLMDVLMPGIDGYKACRHIRRLKQYSQAMPVVMLTSRTSPFDKIRGKMAGCDDYLTKPVRIETLLNTVARHAEK